MKSIQYETLQGDVLNFEHATEMEQFFIAKALGRYANDEHWLVFSAWYHLELLAMAKLVDSPIYKLLNDLHTRLGIKQGQYIPPPKE